MEATSFLKYKVNMLPPRISSVTTVALPLLLLIAFERTRILTLLLEKKKKERTKVT